MMVDGLKRNTLKLMKVSDERMKEDKYGERER
jgi:hypothetical protein